MGGDLPGRARPSIFEDDIPLNARIVDLKDDFRVPDVVDKEKPSPEEIEANKQKWGYAA